MRTWQWMAAMGIAGVWCSACVEESCTEQGQPGVHVVDSETLMPVCGAKATVNGAEGPPVRFPPQDCERTLLIQFQVGTNEVVVSAPGYETQVVPVVVREKEPQCGSFVEGGGSMLGVMTDDNKKIVLLVKS